MQLGLEVGTAVCVHVCMCVRMHVCVHACTCVSSQVSPLCRCDEAEAWVSLGPGPHWEGSVEGALWESVVLAEGGVWGRDRAPLGK